MTNEQIVEQIQNGMGDREHNLLELWDMNRGIIHITISKYAKSVPYEDLKQQAFLALCDAVENYRQTEASFTTYLGFWLRRYCFEEIGKTFPLTIDQNTRTAVLKLRKMQSEYESKFGQSPTDQELQSLLRLDRNTFLRIKAATENMQVISMDAPSQIIEDESITVADSIPDKSVNIETEILDKITAEELHNELEETLEQLPEIQEQVLRNRYYKNMPVEECASCMGITGAEVQKHRERAFRAIRHDRKRYKRLQDYYAERFPSAYHSGFRKFCERGSQTENIAISLFTEELNNLLKM